MAWIPIGQAQEMDRQRIQPAASNSWLQGSHFRAGAANDGERRWQGGGRLLGWWVGVVGGQGHALVGWKVGLSSWGGVSSPLTEHGRMP